MKELNSKVFFLVKPKMYNGECYDQMHAAVSLAALQEIHEYIKPRRSKWKCDWYKSREDFCLYKDLMLSLIHI